jgi:HPt (histidine-containing phosphotransfer) domain-containing protein
LIKEAYSNGDWDQVEKLAHKMKGGTVYCATFKMKYACQYLERYRKAGHVDQLDKLYHQLIDITETTRTTVRLWLQQQNRPWSARSIVECP